jgi:hypothetical protein
LFTVGVSGGAMEEEGRVHLGAVVWYNDEHEVRSPVVGLRNIGRLPSSQQNGA